MSPAGNPIPGSSAGPADLGDRPHPEGAGQFPDTHYPISPYQRVVYATVVRTNPDGTPKHMYPVFDVPSAERAVYLLRHAKPPLTLSETRSVVETAARYLTRGGPGGATPPPTASGSSAGPAEAAGLWKRPERAA